MNPDVFQWRESDVIVRARCIPRYLWMTVSIDVFLDGMCILRTGGQAKMTGSVTSCFWFEGTTHEAKLSWQKYKNHAFPVELIIDDELVAESNVAVENWWMPFVACSVLAILLLLPVLVVVALAVLLYVFM